jgi:hypothetical protein
MTASRLTKAEKQHLLEKALRDKIRRRDANQRAKEARITQGRRRIEKTVPVQYLPEIRRIITEVLTQLEAGLEPRVHPSETAFHTAPAAPVTASTARPTAAPPPGTRGLGSTGRKRAQTIRRRERERADGLTRTTFEIPATLVTTVSALVDRLVRWMSDGFEVTLEKEPIVADLAHPSETKESDLRRPTVAGILDDLFTQEVHDGEQDISPLFEDIQAAAHLAWSVAAGGRSIEPVASEERRGTVPDEDIVNRSLDSDFPPGKPPTH